VDEAVAESLLGALERGEQIEPITATNPSFSLADAYEVLRAIADTRVAAGWQHVGRKIGFTNTTIWEIFGVDAPMWAHLWDRTVLPAVDGVAVVALGTLGEPRIEPEVVFKLAGPDPLSEDPVAILEQVEWMAPGFEVVWSPYPGWKFALPDAAAAFGLHGGLVVGAPVAVTDANRPRLAQVLVDFEATLLRGDEVIDHGVGSNVLGSPALALGYLARVVADQPNQPPLAAGELITTGTITNAFPVAPGETWRSDYGALGLEGLTLRFA
jgi:2-oxo-3-hexenedioate decarboxylase